MKQKKVKNYYIKFGSFIFLLIIGFIIFYSVFAQLKKQEIEKFYPNFTVKINECKFDGTQQGVLSFSFDITVSENSTRIPGQIVFQIIDFYKNYSFHKYRFYHGVNLTREYQLKEIYQENETIKNVTFVIENVYKDYMYLPSEYFNYQLFYCEYNDEELTKLKESKKIFDVLDYDCILFFDFEHFYKDHMYSINQHPGIQCTYIPRYAE
jgi:hypothetical protein